MNDTLYRRGRPLFALVVLALLTLSCNLINQAAAPTTAPTAQTVSGPTATIVNPPNGSEVIVGQEVLVLATAQDTIGVTRVELRVNGFIVNTISTESASGEQTFSMIQSWTPAEVGPAVLQVVPFRGEVAGTAAQISVNVRGNASQVTATAPLPVGVTQIPTNDPTCRARVEVSGLNFRTGPETNYPILEVLTLGEVVEITGRLADNSWWQVRNASLSLGWISAAYTTATGDCSLIGIVQPPPSPSPRPETATPTPLPTSTPIPGSPTPTYTPTPQVPDLVVADVIGPAVLQLNTLGTVGAQYTVRVQNQGTGNSGQFTTSFRHPDGTVQQLPIIVNLAPGQSADLVVDVTFAASDTFQLVATADSGSGVAESDEGNNIRTLNVVVTNAPVLSVTLPGGGIVLTPMIVVTLPGS